MKTLKISNNLKGFGLERIGGFEPPVFSLNRGGVIEH